MPGHFQLSLACLALALMSVSQAQDAAIPTDVPEALLECGLEIPADFHDLLVDEHTIALFKDDVLELRTYPELKEIHRLTLPCQKLEFAGFSTDRKTLFLGGYSYIERKERRHLYRFDLIKKQMMWTREINRFTECFALSPNADMVAIGGWTDDPSSEDHDKIGVVELIDAETGRTRRNLWGLHWREISILQFAHSGKRLAAGSDKAAVVVFNLESGERKVLLAGISVNESEMTQLLYSSEDDVLIAAGVSPIGVAQEAGGTGGFLLAWETEEYSLMSANTFPATRFEAVMIDSRELLLITVEKNGFWKTGPDEQVNVLKRWWYPGLTVVDEVWFPGDFTPLALHDTEGVLDTISGIKLERFAKDNHDNQNSNEQFTWRRSICTVRFGVVKDEEVNEDGKKLIP